jgi:hypothetical protein
MDAGGGAWRPVPRHPRLSGETSKNRAARRHGRVTAWGYDQFLAPSGRWPPTCQTYTEPSGAIDQYSRFW